MGNEHGVFRVSVQGNIVMARLSGCFNESGAEAVTDQIRSAIESFEGQPFCMLMNVLECPGGTPEAYENIENYNGWLNGQKMTAKAMVMSSKMTEGILKDRAPSRQNQKIKIFDNETDAITWLEKHI